MDDSLQGLLARLKAEIEEGQHGDLDREELARLAGEVERRLDADEHDDDGLVGDLEEGAVKFEGSHPELAAGLRRVVNALGALGL